MIPLSLTQSKHDSRKRIYLDEVIEENTKLLKRISELNKKIMCVGFNNLVIGVFIGIGLMVIFVVVRGC